MLQDAEFSERTDGFTPSGKRERCARVIPRLPHLAAEPLFQK